MIRIDFLGTGNAFTPLGRLHSLALIDEKILIDSPPTLITQLRRKGINTSDVKHLLFTHWHACLLYTSPSPRDKRQSRMPSSA